MKPSLLIATVLLSRHEAPMSDERDDLIEIRNAVRALCEEFPDHIGKRRTGAAHTPANLLMP